MTIKLTKKQYEILRAIIRNLTRAQKVRKSYDKRHISRKNEKFEISVSWKAVTILSNCEKEFDK